MKLLPTLDKIVVKPIEIEEMNSGLLLTTHNKKDAKAYEVVAVGPGIPGLEMFVKVGDKVVIGMYAGTEVKDGEDTYIILRIADVLAILE